MALEFLIAFTAFFVEIKEITKEQYLILNSILPVRPSVASGSFNIIMWYPSFKQFFMNPLIGFVKEVIYASVKN